MASVDILRDAQVTNVDKERGVITVTGSDVVDGVVRTQAFETTDLETLNRAKHYTRDESISLIISVDPATKKIGLREQQDFGKEEISTNANLDPDAVTVADDARGNDDQERDSLSGDEAPEELQNDDDDEDQDEENSMGTL